VSPSAACGRPRADSKDLSRADQRFGVHFEALVQTAVHIIRERNPASPEHRGANLALKVRIVEPMLQLGMVADACEIVVRSIRFLEN